MTRYDRSSQALATVLAVLAGFVDASGFIAIGGFFVSFMSGNSTRMGIGLAQGSREGLIAAGLIGTFLLGVIIGALTVHVAAKHHRSTVLGLVAILLAIGAAFHTAGSLTGAVVCMALAMGAINNVFERNGEVSLGVTYMTGSLVKLGQRIATALLGNDRFGWLSYLILWLGFLAGVTAGAMAYPHMGLASLWGVALIAAALACGAAKIDTFESNRKGGGL